MENKKNKQGISEPWARRITILLTSVVFILVSVLDQHVIPVRFKVPEWVYFLPTFNATLNGINLILLLISLIMIRRKNYLAHRRLNITALILSIFFLISYVSYHWMARDTAYPTDSGWRYVYYPLLISHILLAVVVVPLVLFSFYLGMSDQRSRHKKWVRYSYPVWLFVCISGVLIYFMISPYYQH